MKFRLFQRWERASSFGFSALALRVGKKPNVLDRALGFFVCRTTDLYMESSVQNSDYLSATRKPNLLYFAFIFFY
ncbi:hypothetical protein [Winogradskyella sp. SYSU M77433]|uniref:hypothetical protein n=1 Tax=Winogradskyella sp. SYSU M77433 TaxID=3042722 RepID=UPI00248148AD|nr:hypothetical protein [Winogradskyella sp. SYSU M77433]MDH7914621.1 hypothetical protein [Winogradskyella sp. SYSU M77433]